MTKDWFVGPSVIVEVDDDCVTAFFLDFDLLLVGAVGFVSVVELDVDGFDAGVDVIDGLGAGVVEGLNDLGADLFLFGLSDIWGRFVKKKGGAADYSEKQNNLSCFIF